MRLCQESDLLHQMDDFAAVSIEAAARELPSQTISRRQPFCLQSSPWTWCICWSICCYDPNGSFITCRQTGCNPGCLCFLITRRFLLLWFWEPRSELTLTLRCLALKAVYIWAAIGSASNSLCQSHSEHQRVGWAKDQYIPLSFFFFFFLEGSEWSERQIGLIYPSVRLSLAMKS